MEHLVYLSQQPPYLESDSKDCPRGPQVRMRIGLQAGL